MNLTIQTPKPYELQRQILNDPSRFKIVCAGRRAGKTVLAVFASVTTFAEGGSVLLSSTTQDQSDVFWHYVVKWLRPLIDANLVKKNENKRTLVMGNAVLRVKTGRDADALRGGGENLRLIVLDECAYLHPDAWGQVAVPMLTDVGGRAILISTPKRRNWFFHLYTNALSSPDWSAWQFPTFSNPHLSQSAIATLAENMTADNYRQEILAEFLEGDGAVFRYIAECSTATKVEPYEGRFVAGLDWAQKSDYTVMVVLDVDTNRVVDYDRFNGVDWSLQRGRVWSMVKKWNIERVLAEENSIGSPNIEALQREGMGIDAFTTTATSKPPLIESLVLAFDRQEISILDDPSFKGELMAYERTVSSSGRSQYNAPSGLHDDCVIALALAWYNAKNLTRRVVLW